MATISDPAQQDSTSERRGNAWGEHAAIADHPPVPDTRQPSWLELLPTPGSAPHRAEPAPIATHYSIIVVDIVGFGDLRRNNSSQLRVRRGLYDALQQSFDAAGVPWHRCRREDRGDGVLILAPADVPKALLVEQLPEKLADALTTHNKRHPALEQIRLRLALHAGEILEDEHGVTSSSITHTFRILEADVVKTTFTESAGVLAVIGSLWFFEEVIRQSDWSEAHTYVPLDVSHKETETRAWMRVVGRPRARRRESTPLQRRLRRSK
ncbi:MAG TPA: hypothetical protein VGP26_00385 [Actinophytocola sp.]|jgi:hypothetical protein|nr:hypothetical protein [Actinophytocola sp.]